MPEISVIMPVYRAETTLRRAVDSLLSQTFPDWELLMIDDGSDDASPDLCRDYAAKDSRVRYLRQPRNMGVSAARNRGLEEARGNGIAFLDADDAFVPQTLETLWSLRNAANADTAACAHFNVYPNGSQTTELLLPPALYDADGVREKLVIPMFAERLRVPLLNGFLWRFLLSADRIRRLELSFQGTYLEDELFLLEYFAPPPSPGESGKLAVTDTPLYQYYFNPASATRHYMANLPETLDRCAARKAALAKAYNLNCPGWEDNTAWANLLILVGNEYAKGTGKTIRERENTVKEFCRRPDMAKAIANLKPAGMGRNKQLVANLIRGGHFHLLTLLYRVKNRI